MGLIVAVAYEQVKVFEAPETAHAVHAAVDEAIKARDQGRARVILFNFSGHGLLDLSAYDAYQAGKLNGG